MKFWGYLVLLDSRDQEEVIVDELTGEAPGDFGAHLSDYLRKFFVSDQSTPSQQD